MRLRRVTRWAIGTRSNRSVSPVKGTRKRAGEVFVSSPSQSPEHFQPASSVFVDPLGSPPPNHTSFRTLAADDLYPKNDLPAQIHDKEMDNHLCNRKINQHRPFSTTYEHNFCLPEVLRDAAAGADV